MSLQYWCIDVRVPKNKIPEPVLISLETRLHVVRKWGDIGHLRVTGVLSPWSNGWVDGWCLRKEGRWKEDSSDGNKLTKNGRDD